MSGVHRITIAGVGEFLDWRQGSGQTVEIFDIHVPSERRRMGLGRKLVYELIDHNLPPGTKKVWAITRANNCIAQDFYNELNFRAIPLREFYDCYRCVDAIMYIWDVPNKQENASPR